MTDHASPTPAPDPTGDPEEAALAHAATLDATVLLSLAEGVPLADVPEQHTRRRWWVLPLRIGLSIAMLGVLFARIPQFSWSELVPDRSGATFAWAAVSVALSAAAVALSAARWHRVLRGMGRAVPLTDLVPMTFAGQFVSNVLPTTIGGDVLRVTRLARRTGDAPEAFASVSLERLTGWLVLPLISGVGFALDGSLRELGHATSVALTVDGITLTGLVAILVAAGHPGLGGRLVSSAGVRRFLGAVHLGIERLRRRPGPTAAVVGAGLAFQLTMCLAAYAAARVAGIDTVGLPAVLAFYPPVLIAQVLSPGISGLGVREASFVLFLGTLGVPGEKAVALGLLLYLLNVVASLLGAPAFAAGQRHAAA